MPSSDRPISLPQYVLKTGRGGPGRLTVISGSRLSRNAAIDASSGSRRKPTWPRLAAGSSPHATRFSLTRNAFSTTLPLPPSINRQYATVNGRRVLSATGRRYKGAIGQLLMTAASSPKWHAFLRAAQEHWLALTIHFHFPTLLRRDLDGGLKIAQDALCEAMGLNDNRIMEIHLYKTLDRDNPRLECTLSLASPLAPGMRQRSRRSSPLRTSSAPPDRPLPIDSASFDYTQDRQGRQRGKTKGRSPSNRR